MAYEQNAFGVDLSHYDSQVKFDLLKSAGVDFVILKCGGCEDNANTYADTTFPVRVQQAFDAGFRIIGAYYFGSPGYWLKRQFTMAGVENLKDEKHDILQHVLGLLRNKAIDFLAIDMEKASEYPNATDVWYAFFVRDLIERLQRQQRLGNLRPMKFGVYSRRTWIDEKSPALDIYLGTQPDLFIWTAHWAKGSMSVKRMAEIVKERPILSRPNSFGYCDKRSGTWQIWQWAGDNNYGFKSSDAVLTYNGSPRSVDLNLFNGTYQDMLKWLGKSDQSETPKPPTDLGKLIDDAEKKADELKVILKEMRGKT